MNDNQQDYKAFIKRRFDFIKESVPEQKLIRQEISALELMAISDSPNWQQRVQGFIRGLYCADVITKETLDVIEGHTPKTNRSLAQGKAKRAHVIEGPWLQR